MLTQSTPATARTRDTVARMADFITAHAASAGGVTRDDLLLDFSEAEITGNFEAAKQKARNAGKASRQ